MRRAAITGIGVCAPGGRGREGFWDFVLSGRTATRPITLFDASGFRSRIAAEIDWDPAAAGLAPAEARELDRMVQFAVFALSEALKDSGLPDAGVPAERVAVSVGTAVGATIGLDNQYAAASDRGRHWLVDPGRAVPWLYDYVVPTPLAREVAWRTGAEGPVIVVSTGCTSGVEAVGHALELVREGSADVVVTGASDAPISPITSACFDAIRATSPNNEDPARACRPFDADRDGFVLGEGAAILVLEEFEHAKRRGAHVYAELAGFATRCNAFHMTGLHKEGRELGEAITSAMREAELGASGLGYVSAHGSGTQQNDAHETAALKRGLGRGAYEVPVSSIKAAIGHALGSVGSIELAACALAIEHGALPPTANLDRRDPRCDLDYVPNQARDRRVPAALCVGSGFGGFQSAAVLTDPEGRAR
ncbi:beta-ketoacyl-[acyl-carrier-protein] synthase family protein [Spirillospora sp. CA-294931]|uniref:beta-ketoacyl-[acyl-carrier-protein] synthase family protein n=1 Tax=Spirillospora sp. CA-294931 TaxID=3240042 RepID=UPI003D926748